MLACVQWRALKMCRLQAWRWAMLLASTALCLVVTAADIDLNRAHRSLIEQFGSEPESRYFAWEKLILDLPTAPDSEKLRRTNTFFNRQIRAEEDASLWRRPDYWATPVETIGQGAGDCEDYTIAKYFTLKAMGIPEDRLRLVYVRARIGGPNSTIMQAHMVLAYYATADADPIILDNLVDTASQPASVRIWYPYSALTAATCGTHRAAEKPHQPLV